MKKRILVVLFFGTTAFLNAEQSAFDAGNINNNSAYGLTQNEQIIKKRLDDLQNNYMQNSSNLNNINERLEGLQSTLEGINSQYSKSNSRLNALEDREANLSKELSSLKAYVRESRKIQEENNKEIKKTLEELSKMLSADVNLDLNSTDTLKEDNKEDNNDTKIKQEEEKKEVDESWKKKDSDDILNLAMKEFKSKKTLEQAKAKFEYLLSKNYKPARANFYLGEIEYKQKRYANAINYYKKSTSLYSKADYMPTLLYHTAISLDKVGDTKSANGFYKALKATYPKSPEAKASPNRK